ncbi:hypothetical protein G7Y89_g7350 [Cudoniella acicularis]|uniref:ABC transporter n=1 Tax=Cudoniella acicularis TaxID=354080 RepID=A0A8H4RL40_9HELO|nr:hypothetical protein G7Y89_g7350 [Cudoniella acicularis]
MSPASSNCTIIDSTFGPYAGECRGGFDFTLLFEEAILCILPLGLALLASPIRFILLSKEGIKVIPNRFLYVKLVSYAALAGLQLSLLVRWAQQINNKSILTTTSVSLSIIGTIVFGALSFAEHRRAIRPSSLISLYLFFSLLFDAARTRTIWLRATETPLSVLTTLATVTKFFILILETVEKRGLLRPGHQNPPPYATAGFFNRILFCWLNPLFRKGFSRTLSVNDLYALDKPLVSKTIHESIRDSYDELPERSPEKVPHALLWTTMSTLKWSLLSAVIPRACLTGFNFCQPFLISASIAVSQAPLKMQFQNQGYGLIGAYVFVYVGIAISTGLYQHLTYRTITMARGGMIAMLFSKTVNLSVSAIDPSASVTLMSADIERIATGWQTIHDMWANVIEIGLAIYLLYRQLGVACAVPIGVAIFSMFGSIVASGLVMQRQALWLQAIEKRITATTAMLGAMKGIKICGLTDIVTKMLQDFRVNELRISKKFRKILVWNMMFSFSTPVAAPILTFTVFSVLAKNKSNGSTLDTNKVFTSLSLFTLLSEPLGSLIMALANFMGSVGSFHRIQEFLETDVRVDNRKVSKPLELPPSSTPLKPSTTSSATQSITEIDDLPGYPFAHPNPVVVQDGSFGWDKEKDPILSSINFSVPPEKFTMLVGPVGCGKSTLIKALLGEALTLHGSVQLSTPEVAFCDQTAWHMNATVRQSITGISRMDESWYNSVTRACALEQDFKQLPKGDRTIIGSSGTALSGGQSQRIALARAVYSQKDIIILDDIFRGLDPETENQVFHNLLGQRGLLRKHRSTIIVASSATTRLPYADHIIVLNESGKIAEQGTFSELNTTGGYVSAFNLSPPDWNKANPDGIIPFIDIPGPYHLSKEAFDVDVAEDDDEPAKDDPSRRVGDTGVYFYYLKAVGWIPSVIFVIGICGFVVCFSLPAIWVKWWAEDNAKTPNEHLKYYLGIYGLIGALALISLMAAGWEMVVEMVPRSGEHFHWVLLKTVLNSPMSFFSTTDSGETLNRFSQDLQLIDMDLPLAALNTFATFILCIAQIVIIGVSSIYAPIAFPIILLALFFIQKFYLRTSRQLRMLDLEAKSPLYSQFLECLSGLVTIRAFGWSQALEAKNMKLLDQSQRPFYQLFAIQRWLVLVLDLLVAGIAILLISLVVSLRGKIDVGFVGVALLNVILFSQSVKLLLTFWTTLETHLGSIARIKTFTTGAATEEVPSSESHQEPPALWPHDGAIEFKSVSAAYKFVTSLLPPTPK